MPFFQKKWRLAPAWRRPLLLLASFLILILKFSFLFSQDTLSGWSLHAQTHLAEIYDSLLNGGQSLGYDTRWFSGMPVFFYEPPFFYFMVAILHKTVFFWSSLSLSFNIGILISILLFTYAFIKFSLLLLSETNHRANTVMLAMTGLLFFFLCAGEEPFGLSLVGLFNGSVTGFFGLGWSLLGFYYLEKYRTTGKLSALAKYLVVSACVYYSDFPSSMFYLVSLLIYFLFLGEELGKRAFSIVFFTPLLFAAPVWWNFLKYSSYRAETFPMESTPGLISILGSGALKPIWEGSGLFAFLWNFVVGLHWIQAVFPILFLLGIRSILKRKIFPPASRFVFFASLIFYWIGVDTSLSKFFPGIGFPWFRALDLSLLFLTLSALETAVHLLKNKTSSVVAQYSVAALLFFALIRFFNWHPELEWKENTTFLKDSFSTVGMKEVEAALSELPKDSKIFPEIDSRRKWGDSPFTLGLIIRRAGHRNVLGMEADASLSSLAIQPYLSRYLPWTSWKRNPGYEEELPDEEAGKGLHRFLQSNGTSYVLGSTEKFYRILKSNPERFELVKGWVNEDILQTNESPTHTYEKELENKAFLFLFKVKDPGSDLAILTEKAWGVADYRELTGGKALRPKRFLYNTNEAILHEGLDSGIVFARVGKKEIQQAGGNLSKWFQGILVLNVPPTQAFWKEELKAEFGDLQFLDRNEFFGRFFPVKDRAKVEAEIPRLSEIPVLPIILSDEFVQSETKTVASVSEAKGPEKNSDCKIVRRSFFPKWEDENGGVLFQTQRNEILVCSENKDLRLRFWKGNSPILTIVMFLLPVLFLFAAFVKGRWFFR
ncbi:hypothetical protein EHQ53_00065 [Leptospira langatensis]|uniref:Membrane protein 6-pyruvoyl-tetrahydropterin synthase-related domain-containing protein n=1 Tax=Leptospira langatensis TaxID=2484983 RepID=A0A5F1ZWP3_9LEPT|nr:hypothetical protein [Leptospira langatensis]TGJ98170.1 hypothetical protein EHO57_16210 [Leptospira langatensis]TGL43084.1 hypothetical protein EHQ53_00065 [Leptospira langatensis]